MGKRKKRNKGKGEKNPADKRPGQLIALLAVVGAGVLANLYLWFEYANVVGGNSLPVPAEALSDYRKILLLNAFLYLLIWVLLFFGKKAGFWIAAVLYGIDLISKLTDLNLLGGLVTGLCLYLLLCQPTRIYFRVGQFKAFGPREK